VENETRLESELAASSGLRGWPARVVGRVLSLLPAPLREQLLRHREVLKFLVVGGTCFLISVTINYALKLTVLNDKPVTALTIATVIANVVSYILNREWSFRTRGGRKRHHEALLFFAISAVAVGINDVPMYAARYLLDLRVPAVSLLTQEVSDFVSGIVLGTLIAMVFRLWAFKKWVFPLQNARPDRAGRSDREGRLDVTGATARLAPAQRTAVRAPAGRRRP
jgi:putative flippase GtrA